MATPELAIAKAALSAALFRADPTSTSRPSVDSFFQLLNSALTQCSRPNVQNCKDYITNNIALSSGRVTALGKYLVALSKAQVDNGTDAIRPSTKRRRLHVLYLVNDVLHHHRNELSSTWEPFLPALFASASSYDNCPKHTRKLEDLIGLWKERQYVSDETIAKLKEALARGAGAAPPTSTAPNTKNDDENNDTTKSTSLKLAKETPYIIPSYHGDASTAWYDLPAATWLPHLVPNSTKPMLPDQINPIQFAPGPANKVLAAAVKALVSDAERIFSKESLPEDEGVVDINELGERIILDELTGDIIGGETYYGWSRQFCEHMKRRKKGKGSRSKGSSVSRSSSPSRSRSRSSSRDGSYSRSRRRDSSSRSAKRRRIPRDSRSRSRSVSRSRSRSRTSSRSISRSISRSRSPSRSRARDRSHKRSYTPSRSPSHDTRPRSPSRSPARQQEPTMLAPPQPPPPFPPNMSMPIPPRPAGYNGPWPPPPPPLPFPPQGWIPDPAFAALPPGPWTPGQIPPLPVPPIPQYQEQYQQQQVGYDGHENRGFESEGYRGRGGRGGGRGRGRGFYRGSR
ncbi:hypothetical protein E4U16_001999 [Claviceps sp. LM84 group G4]|nr:hypothetical protein E4U16_001999 [Claviceps sp. LM84 group G4]KAG6079822.1 hypothetical protein E4U33_008083 [Claviceps sp. LM78 group G4]